MAINKKYVFDDGKNKFAAYDAESVDSLLNEKVNNDAFNSAVEEIESEIEQKANTEYVNEEIARLETIIEDLPEPMIFKGTLGTGGTIEDLPTASASNEGFTYKVITAGTYAGQTAKVGDVFTSNGSSWVLIPSGDEDNDTWRAIKVEGVEVLGNGISSGAVDFVGSENIEVDFDGNGNKVGVKTKNIYTKAEVNEIVADAIYDVLPSEVASGSVANFETDLALPLKSLEVDVNAVQEAGTPTPATPLPISGWSEIKIARTGKNLLSPNLYKGLSYNPTVGTTVTLTESPKQLTDNHDGTFSISTTANWETFCMIVPIKSTTYYRKTVISSNGALGTTEVWLDKNLKVISTYNNTDTTQTKNGLLNIPNNASYFVWVITNRMVANATLTITQPQLELGSTATVYEPYVGNEYIINLGGTYYGGYLTQDKAGHRQFRVTHGIYNITGQEGWSWQDGYWRTVLPASYQPAKNQTYTQTENGVVTKMVNGIYIIVANSENPTITGGSDMHFIFPNGQKFVYELATPYVIDLPDGEPINTFKGINNFFADSGDTTITFKQSVNDAINAALNAANNNRMLGMINMSKGNESEEKEETKEETKEDLNEESNEK